MVTRSGLIGGVAWNSGCAEFCAVWGLTPAKATTFSLKWNPVSDFGTRPQNAAYSSPPGRRLVSLGVGI